MGFLSNLAKEKNPKKDTRTKRYVEFALSLLAILIALLYIYDPLIPKEKETGRLVNVDIKQTYYGSRTFFVAELQSGEIVTINASRMGPFKKDQEVIVQKLISKIFGKKKYRFVQYKK